MFRQFCFYFCLTVLLISQISCVDQDALGRRTLALTPADDFIFIVKTDNPGVSDDDKYVIHGNSNSNYHVDCNDDGIWERRHLNNIYTCDYSTLGGPGTYTIRISGTYPSFAPRGNPEKILSVEQWGSMAWFGFSFANAIHLNINATDVPNLQNVIGMNATFVNTDLSASSGNWNWDTSQVISMHSMFRGSNFNADISGWDTGNVQQMRSMFESTPFNQDISGWDTGKVLYFPAMFLNASEFNQDIRGWDTANALTFNSMFHGATSFNRDLSSWTIGSARNFGGFYGNTAISTANYDAILNSWSNQNTVANVLFTARNVTYCTGEAGRAAFAAKGWTVTDGGKQCSVNVELGSNISEVETNSPVLPQLLILGTLENPETVSVVDSGTGSATAGLDYQFASPLIITIPVGTYDGTSATAIDISGFSVVDDSVVESDETIILEIVQPSTDVIFGDTNNDGVRKTFLTYTILDQDICAADGDCPVDHVCNQVYSPALCQIKDLCGNSILENGEFCDDGNFENDDGCNDNCQIEEGETCDSDAKCATGLCDQSGPSGRCELPDTCGNGRLEMDEVCDDGNINLSDGCDENCKLEDGAECNTSTECASGICDGTSQPAKCEPSGLCGNATPEPGEGCDDGNIISGDGCDENCKLEDENNCAGDRNCQEGLICNGNKKCVLECQSDMDCGGNKCDLGRCINCVADGDCGEFEVCNLANNRCQSECDSNDDCLPTGFCNESKSRCVECRDDLDCLGGETCTAGICESPACNTNDADCQSDCVESLDCEGVGRPQCEVDSKTCVECLNNEHCRDGEICEQDFACQPACRSDGDCERGKCHPEGQCVDCLSNSDCERGTCELEKNVCEIECDKKEDCKEGYYCASDANICLEGCQSDTDCDDGICDLDKNKCRENPVEENPKPNDGGKEEGCGCSSTQSSDVPIWIFLLGVFFWRKRRVR